MFCQDLSCSVAESYSSTGARYEPPQAVRGCGIPGLENRETWTPAQVCGEPAKSLARDGHLDLVGSNSSARRSQGRNSVERNRKRDRRRQGADRERLAALVGGTTGHASFLGGGSMQVEGPVDRPADVIAALVLRRQFQRIAGFCTLT